MSSKLLTAHCSYWLANERKASGSESNRGLWCSLIKEDKWEEFISLPREARLETNLWKDYGKDWNLSWATLFGMSTLLL